MLSYSKEILYVYWWHDVSLQVEGGPNPPEDDLSPVKGNITFPPGKATVVYNLTVLDDEVGCINCLRGTMALCIMVMLENIMSSIKLCSVFEIIQEHSHI